MLFLHRYAIAIGWPVPILKKVMSSRDISEAMAYERIEPFGELRADYRNAMLCSLIASSNGMKNVKIDDFMPKFNGRKKQTESEISKKVKEVFKFGNTSKFSN